jgi:hypothetical protein
MKVLDDERISLNCTDSKRVVKILEAQHSNERGLIYYDPEGAPQFRTTLAAAKAAPRMDVLVHIGASLIKRQIGRSESGFNVSEELLITLEQYVETLGRKHNYISNCQERQQWIFLYSTDSETFVPPTGLLDITSENGKILFDFAKNTKVDYLEPENTKTDLQEVLSDSSCWASLK